MQRKLGFSEIVLETNILLLTEIVVVLRLKSSFPSYRKACATVRRRRESCFLLFV